MKKYFYKTKFSFLCTLIDIDFCVCVFLVVKLDINFCGCVCVYLVVKLGGGSGRGIWTRNWCGVRDWCQMLFYILLGSVHRKLALSRN